MAETCDSTAPKISIIVPVYNVEKYLRRCLDSIASQTFNDWECILIDDGSPDNSGSICDEYAEKDSRFRVIHQKNAGVSAARNAGLDAARGEWIGFVDSDDWIEKDCYEILIEIATRERADVVRFNFKNYDFTKQFQKGEFYPNEYSYFPVGFNSVCLGFYQKRLLIENAINFNKEFFIGEDALFNYKSAVFANKIYCTDKAFYNYFENSESAMHTMSIEKIKQTEKLFDYIEMFLVQNNRFDDFKFFLSEEKLGIKNRYIFYLKKPDCTNWRKTFSELNKNVLKRKDNKKILYVFLLLHLDICVYFVVLVYRNLKKLIGKRIW